MLLTPLNRNPPRPVIYQKFTMKDTTKEIKEAKAKTLDLIHQYIVGTGKDHIQQAVRAVAANLTPVIVIHGMSEEAIHNNGWMKSWEDELMRVYGRKPFLIITDEKRGQGITVEAYRIKDEISLDQLQAKVEKWAAKGLARTAALDYKPEKVGPIQIQFTDGRGETLSNRLAHAHPVARPLIRLWWKLFKKES